MEFKRFFENNLGVCRECILTAFSLNPTEETLKEVEQIAIATGKLKLNDETIELKDSVETLDTGQKKIWSCPLHAPYDESSKIEGRLLDLCCSCGSFRVRMAKTNDCSMDALLGLTGNSITTYENYDTMSSPNSVLDSLVQHVPLSLCEDLVSIISSIRVKTLTWLHDWSELSKACENYMYFQEGTFKSAEGLKYLKIDYRQFESWPKVDKFSMDNGIEKGYEMCADLTNDDTQDSKYDSDDFLKFKDQGIVKRRKIQQSEEVIDNVDTTDAHATGTKETQDFFSKVNNLSNDVISYEKSRSKLKLNSAKELRTISAKNSSKNSFFADSKENKNSCDGTKQSSVIGESKICDFSNLTSIISPEKKSSDPNVLKSLRKYRPNMKSKASKKLNNNPSVVKYVNEYAPALSELNLSPRVILNRCVDEGAMEDGTEGDFSSKACVKMNKISNENGNRENIESKTELSVCNSNCNILSGIPGLSSFDMLIPDKVQPIVQIVQLVHNTSKQPMSPPKVSRSSSQSNITITTSTPNSNMEANRISIGDSMSQSGSLSTPVTPHIQRIGQATLNCDSVQVISSVSAAAVSSVQSNPQVLQTSNVTLPDLVPASQTLDNVSTDSSPSTSISQLNVISNASQANNSRLKISNSTLTNLLTNRITMPTKSGNPNLKSNPTILNVLSQKILRPPFSSSNMINCNSIVSTAQSTPHTSNNSNLVSSTLQTSVNSQTLNANITSSPQSQQHLLQILNQSQKQGSSQVIKGVNLISGLSGASDSKLVQFICKTDGKTFQLTPFSANPANVRIQQVDNRVFKSASSTQVRPLDAGTGINTRSVYEENYAKFIQTANKITHIHNTSKQPNTVATTLTVSSNQNTSLPKFNQAFGKAAFHNSGNPDSTNEGESSSASNNVTNLPVIKTYKSDADDGTLLSTVVQNAINPVIIKRSQLPSSTSTVTTLAGTASRTAMTPLSVQTVHGGVIYTRQIPINTGSLFNANINRSPVKLAQSSVDTQAIQTVEPVMVSKSSVVRNKVNTLLAATFTPPVSSDLENAPGTPFTSQTRAESSEGSSTETTRTSLQQPLYALQTSLPIKLNVPSSAMFSNAKVVRPVLQIPNTLLTTTCPIKQQLVLTATPAPSTRMSQSSRLTDNLISTSPMDSSVSSSTLEQLREFDMVLEQVKERSTVQPNIQVAVPSPNVQVSLSSNISHGLLIPQSQNESSESVLHVSTASFGQEVVFTTTVSPLTQRLNLTYMSQNLAKLAGSTPVVVVTNYQQAPSPALSVTSQSSSSPCVTPAPTTPISSAGKTPPKVTSKSKSKTVKTNSTSTSKASPVPKPLQKPQEDEQTAQRIYDILAEYAEQLRNSPDLNNKPAPRRRSNPSANPGPNSKRKKSSGSKRPPGQGTSNASEMSPGADDHHTMGSEDSSCGLVQISMQNSPSQGISSMEDCIHDTSSDVGGNVRSAQSDSSDGTATTSETKPQALPPARHVIFTDPNGAQQRNVIITETAVGEALAQVGKLGSSTATVLVPGNYILPMSMVKGGQQITIVSGGSKILATVPTRPGTNANALVLQSILNQAQKPIIAQQASSIKIPAIQTMTGLTQSVVTNNQTSVAQKLPSGNQINQQVAYIESIADKGSTAINSLSTSQGKIILNSSTSTMNVVCASPSKVGSANVTGFISKSPAVVRTYSTITHTSSNNNGQKLSQADLVKIKNNFSVEDNNELKINVTPDVSTIVSTSNILTESQGRYTLSISSPAVLTQNIGQTNTSVSDIQSLRTNKPKLSKESNNIPVQTANAVVTSSLACSNPVIKLVNSSNRENINTSEVFESSDTAQDERAQSILINTNNRIINGPLLSQMTNHVYQSSPTITNSVETIDGNENGQIKTNNDQKDNKVENGMIDQNEIFSKESTPWRYVPTTSNVEYLTMGDEIKFFRENVDANCENICDKTGEDMDTKSYQSHLNSDIIKKRYVNSMISSYGTKSDRLKNATLRASKQLQQQTLERKQAALERELRLQKSLSEECEDLGVDEPSTSDLFPEADLLFDPSHSFDQNSQDATCSQAVGKNYIRANFKSLDSSSNSTDTDYVKAELDDTKHCRNAEQNEGYLLEQPAKVCSTDHGIISASSCRSNNYIVQTDDNKKEPLSDFDNNSEFMFSTTSFSRSVDESCMELVFESTDKNSNKNGKDECLHANHNSNSIPFEPSGEQTSAETSPNLPSHISRTKSRKSLIYVNCKSKENSSKINWESELEHSTTEDEMQFTEDDSSQGQLENFHAISSGAGGLTPRMNKRKRLDTLEGNGLNADKVQSMKNDFANSAKRRKSMESDQMADMENLTSSPISPSEEHTHELVKGSTRRLSLRGHVKKNCACCNGKAVADTVPVVKKPRSKVDNMRAVKINRKPTVSPKIKNLVSKKR